MSPMGLVLVGATAALTAVANMLLVNGIRRAQGLQLDSVADAIASLLRLAAQPLFVAGFLLYFAASLVWFRVLSTEPLGLAYPLVVSVTFVLVTAAATFVLAEPLTLHKLAGLATIVAGIAIVSLAR